MLIDSRAKDAHACLVALDGRALDPVVTEASELLATVVGQDLDIGDDGVFRIVRRVAKDRVISTVDPEARHGHKTAARGFDGYKGHVAVDPDSEIVTATTVTPGNASDVSVATDLIDDLLGDDHSANGGDDDNGGSASTNEATDVVIPADNEPEADAGTATVYGDTRMAPARSSPVSKTRASSRSARPRNRTPGLGSLPRTVSWSTSKTTPSPALTGSPSPSGGTSKAAVWPSSPSRVIRAHSARGAPSRPRVAISPSG